MSADQSGPKPFRPTATGPQLDDEGGLWAPPELTGWRKAWWWFDFIVLVKLARLRFIAILVVIGLVITQWDLLAAYYEKWQSLGESPHTTGNIEWYCPMHPTVVRDNGKEKCPVCFMPLAKRKIGEKQDAALPAGIVNRVQLTPYRVVLAGVQTWRAEYLPLDKEITAVGSVEFNERGQRNVSARVKGRIDQLFVNETGQMVDEGDVLASLYSPDLNVTVQNLVDARRNKNLALEQSARTRLQLLGISDDQIDEILASGKSNTHLKIRSPISGHVIKKYVREGQYVDEGTPLYDVADLSTVWIQAQIYEDDMIFLPIEQAHKSLSKTAAVPVMATTRAFPDEPFAGTLAFIYPHVDQDTRTVTVRCELNNPGHKLRPGMTATVRIMVAAKDLQVLVHAAAGDTDREKMLAQNKVLGVPESSVIDTGSQTIVYRATSPGVFEGVKVDLGPRMSGPEGVSFFPVLRGLNAGDTIVTSGSFLVDAETRLNPAAGSIYLGGGENVKSSGSNVTNVRPSMPDDIDAKITAELSKLSDADRRMVELQRVCPVLSGSRLGSMGPPIKLMIEGQPVFICCPSCKKGATDHPQETLEQTNQLKSVKPAVPTKPDEANSPAAKKLETKIQASLAKLSVEDRRQAELQRFCPVNENSRLGSMDKPVKIMVDGQPVFICCEACREAALANARETAAKVESLKKSLPAIPGKQP